MVLVKDSEALYVRDLVKKLRVLCGSLLKTNLNRKRMVAWVEDSRSTVLSCAQLEQGDFGLPLPDEACMTVALSVRLRTNVD